MITGPQNSKFARERQRMVEHDLKGRGITEAGVLSAMGRVLRKEFVPESYESRAYEDGPLPIGMGQTISQPYIVALMTQELRLNNYCEVLEIGTGSGYQTAVLAKLAKRVYTVERFADLSAKAQAVLGRLGINNIEFYVGDGSAGWPFDTAQNKPRKRRLTGLLLRRLCLRCRSNCLTSLAQGVLLSCRSAKAVGRSLSWGQKKKESLLSGCRVMCGLSNSSANTRSRE